MMEMNHGTQDQTFGVGPLLLTEDEIATVGGGIGGAAAANLALAVASSVAVGGAPFTVGILAGALIVGGAVAIWNGVKSTSAK